MAARAASLTSRQLRAELTLGAVRADVSGPKTGGEPSPRLPSLIKQLQEALDPLENFRNVDPL
jgi:hypothetical protein